MASLIKSKTKKGTNYHIQLSDGERLGRPKISLGKCTKRSCETAKTHIEALISSLNTGSVISPQTQEWIVGLTPSVRKRLEYLELIEPMVKMECFTVRQWCNQYIALLEKDRTTKAGTVRKLQNIAGKLRAFFPNERLDEVNKFTARAFRSYLVGTAGLAENTVRRYIAMARQFFNAAIENKLITENPFRGQPVKVRANPSRFYFVTPEIAQKVLDACPDAKWRLIFGFGSLWWPSLP